jgi:hypothetical protein
MVKAMQKEKEVSAGAVGVLPSAVYTEERAQAMAHQLAALRSKTQPPADGSVPVVERELTRFGNPKRKAKLTCDQKIAIIKQRRVKSDGIKERKRIASDKRKDVAARNRQAKKNRSNKHKIDQQIRRDQAGNGAANGKRAATAADASSNSEDAPD